MASFSSLRTVLPAAHGCTGVPVAALKEVARSGASFLVVCPTGARAEAVATALQAATKGAGQVLYSRYRVVARATKSSAGVEDGRTGEDPDDDRTGEEVMSGDIKAEDIGAGDDLTGNKVTNDVFVRARGRTGNDSKATKEAFVYRSGEMTMEELALLFQKNTATLLKQIEFFPMSDDFDEIIPDLIASCDALGDQLRKVDSTADRTTLYQSLIALHLRIVSSADGVTNVKPGSYMPDMCLAFRHQLPSKKKRAGTLMELLLYSMMLASAAMAPYVSAPKELDFHSYD